MPVERRQTAAVLHQYIQCPGRRALLLPVPPGPWGSTETLVRAEPTSGKASRCDAYNKEPRQLQAAVSQELSTAIIARGRARGAPADGDTWQLTKQPRRHHAPASIPSRLAQRPRSGLALTVASIHTLPGIPGQPAGGCPAASGVQPTGGATLACVASSQWGAGERAQGRGLARPRAPWTGSSNTRLFSTGVETRASWHRAEVGHA